jgi:membrane dipeptidase
MLIVDGHLDLAYSALQYNRDLLYSAFTIRVHEAGTTDVPGASRGTVALPEMRQGRVALSLATVIAACTGNPKPHLDFSSPTQAYGIARGQLAYYRALEKEGHLRVVTDITALNSHIAEWEAWDASENADTEHTPPLGVVISMEGADPILRPDELQEWWELGLRIMILSHFGTKRYAGGTGNELGLTELGVSLLAEMERLGVLLDLTHCSDQAFWQALEHYNGPVLASHSNSRALVPNQRQFSDEQMRVIIERDGVIGTSADIWMLEPGWIWGVGTNEHVTLGTMVDHIDHVCQLAGNSRHAAIGTDLDGGYGQDQAPRDLETIADLQKLIGLLADRGYSMTDVANIMYRNWVRLLRQIRQTVPRRVT